MKRILRSKVATPTTEAGEGTAAAAAAAASNEKKKKARKVSNAQNCYLHNQR
jgi:hypothetical protein